MNAWRDESERQILVIVNPTAGRGAARRQIARLQERLSAAGFRAVFQTTERPAHATELARRAAEAGVPFVGALGGDGTVREVATALVGTPSVLVILPFGSGNDLARSLGIPRNIPGASRLLWREGGKVISIDVGREEEGPYIFTLHSALGFAAEVSHHATRFRFIRGSAAYFAGVFRAVVGLRPIPIRVQLDDRTMEREAVFAMVLNAPYCGGGQLMAPDANLLDGTLELVLVDPISRLELIRTFPKVYSGRHVDHPAFHLFQGKRIVVEPIGPAYRIVDGDEIGAGSLRASAVPGALRVLVPADYQIPPTIAAEKRSNPDAPTPQPLDERRIGPI